MFSLILVVPAHPQFRVMSVGMGFFGHFPGQKKSPKSATSPSPRVPARSSSWTPAACTGKHAADEYDEYFEYNGALWKQAWDQEHQCYCWCEVRGASCRCSCRLGSYSSALSDLEPSRYIVMAL